MANYKNSTVIFVEDIYCPTKYAPICEVVIKYLNAVGITDNKITVNFFKILDFKIELLLIKLK